MSEIQNVVFIRCDNQLWVGVAGPLLSSGGAAGLEFPPNSHGAPSSKRDRSGAESIFFWMQR